MAQHGTREYLAAGVASYAQTGAVAAVSYLNEGDTEEAARIGASVASALAFTQWILSEKEPFTDDEVTNLIDWANSLFVRSELVQDIFNSAKDE